MPNKAYKKNIKKNRETLFTFTYWKLVSFWRDLSENFKLPKRISIAKKKNRKKKSWNFVYIFKQLFLKANFYLSWTGVEPSNLRYLWPLIRKYCSMMSNTIVNWVNINTRSSLSRMRGNKSSKSANLPLSQIWWLPKL